MDKDLFYISLAFLIIGIGGQLVGVFFGANTVASFHDVQGVTGYMMMIGFLLLPAGLFKDGLPSPGAGVKIFMGLILIIILGVSLTALVVYPGAKTTANPCAVATCGSISILPGSSNPNQLITFSPKVAVVILGLNNTVQWKNTDTVSHTVTSNATAGGLGGLNSAAFGSQETYTYTFTQAGTYFYYCSIHPTMHGEVIVKTHG